VYTHIQVVFDAAEPVRLADFWGLALGYVQESPPPGFATWEDFARSINLPEEKWGDVRVATGLKGEERAQRIETHVARLLEAGASIAWPTNNQLGQTVVLRDPEGNEFCVC
jgi:hypothetical protein